MTRESMDDTAPTAHDAAFSRSAGLLAAGDKATDCLKTNVPDEVGDDWRRLARSLGMSSSELLRTVIFFRLYGFDGVATMTQEQLRRAAGVGTERGQTAHPPTPQGGPETAEVLPEGRR